MARSGRWGIEEVFTVPPKPFCTVTAMARGWHVEESGPEGTGNLVQSGNPLPGVSPYSPLQFV